LWLATAPSIYYRLEDFTEKIMVAEKVYVNFYNLIKEVLKEQPPVKIHSATEKKALQSTKASVSVCNLAE
jgi:hypothetical protein